MSSEVRWNRARKERSGDAAGVVKLLVQDLRKKSKKCTYNDNAPISPFYGFYTASSSHCAIGSCLLGHP